MDHGITSGLWGGTAEDERRARRATCREEVATEASRSPLREPTQSPKSSDAASPCRTPAWLPTGRPTLEETRCENKHLQVNRCFRARAVTEEDVVSLMSDATTVSGGLGRRRWAHPGRDRPGAADGGPGPDGDEHRAAVGAAGTALHHGGPAVGGHRLRPGVRQPTFARRQAGGPAGPEGHVLDRAGRLRGRVGDRRRVGQLRHAGDRAGLPGRVRRAAGALGAVAADHHVHRAEGPRQGVRRLRGDRRGRRRDRAAARRRADRVPVLALVHVREPVLRRGGLYRRRAAADASAVPGQAEAGHPGRAAGLRRGVLPGLRVLQRRRAQLAHTVHLRIPGRRRGAGRGVRAVAEPGGPPAAAAPHSAGPQPGRRLPVDAHRLGRAVRDLLVLDLLPAADAGRTPRW